MILQKSPVNSTQVCSKLTAEWLNTDVTVKIACEQLCKWHDLGLYKLLALHLELSVRCVTKTQINHREKW